MATCWLRRGHCRGWIFPGDSAESRTLVAVPTLLIGADNIERLVEALEVQWLANRDDNLQFGLLTDFGTRPRK